jgi:8-oxo-dGTP pyrophosphatase MutT (NUDIX family)
METDMRWEVHGQRPLYSSEWVELRLDDVQIPGGRRFEHHVLHFPKASTTAVALDHDHALMIWRHRFITDTWGWEVPAGWADEGEEPETAIRREVEEETGWRPSTVTPMTQYYAINGISDMRFTAFLAEALTHIGPPVDTSESTRVEWIPLADIPKLVEDGQLTDGPSLMALSYYLGMWRTLHP